ncbi:ABC transporter substrate-binding protein [Streptomyces sp. NPDC048483]|uniref:ABC transporter substrate-binding protein n=1 Tax=Streptomyces sp. NPDC048483 TaxID=3154927 RepID=UPI0034163F22
MNTHVPADGPTDIRLIDAPASPLIGAADLAESLAEYGDLPRPAPHTQAELAALIGLLARPKARVETVTVGHSRDPASRAAAEAFTAAWQARGGTVLAVVDWPESAASWLRPAKRLTAEQPDAWVIAAAPLGFAQLARRLRHSTDWDPARTVAFAALQDSRLPALTGPDTLHGLRGASTGGGTWEVNHRWVTARPPAAADG